MLPGEFVSSRRCDHNCARDDMKAKCCAGAYAVAVDTDPLGSRELDDTVASLANRYLGMWHMGPSTHPLPGLDPVAQIELHANDVGLAVARMGARCNITRPHKGRIHKRHRGSAKP